MKITSEDIEILLAIALVLIAIANIVNLLRVSI